MTAEPLNITEVIDRRPISALQKRIIALCFCLAFVEGFGAQNAGFVAPVLARVWHLKSQSMGLYFSLGLFGLMLGALFVAPLADRLGRKPVLLGCAVAFGLCSIGQALAPSIEVLFLFRFLNLLGIGGSMPNAIAMTSEYSPSRSRSFMIVLMFTGFSIGSLVVGLLAARILQQFDWNSVFVVAGVLPLLLALMIFCFLPESARFLVSRGHHDSRVTELMRKIDPSIDPDARFVADDHSSSRMSVLALFREGRAPQTVFLWILVFCSLLDLFLMSNWLPILIHSLGIAVGVAIVIGTLLQAGGVLGLVLGWVMDRFGPAKTLCGAYIVAALSIASIGLVGASVTLLSLSVLIAGFGIVGGQTAANAVAAESYPTEIRATGVGWFLGIGRVGSIVGPYVAGILLHMGISNRDLFLLTTVPAVVAALAALGLGVKSGVPPAHVVDLSREAHQV